MRHFFNNLIGSLRRFRPGLAAIFFATTLGLASCARTSHGPPIAHLPELPEKLKMNSRAGRGTLVFVMVRLENGKQFPCALDTGAPTSLLPKAAEPELGNCISTGTFSTLGGGTEEYRIFATPRLYIGNTPIVTSRRIGTWDSSMGVLGMDCLRHYCIQLDFEMREVRFLNPRDCNERELGKALPILLRNYVFINRGGLLGEKNSKTLVDTGCWFDGLVSEMIFQREYRKQNASFLPSRAREAASPIRKLATFPRGAWDGEHYDDLIIGQGRSIIGLRFLARHLVTFDFPHGKMYLKRRTRDPLAATGAKPPVAGWP